VAVQDGAVQAPPLQQLDAAVQDEAAAMPPLRPIRSRS
jgi:hypothetical protein